MRAVISGYYGFNNLGDEAVLYSMLQVLKEKDPNFDPVVLSADPVFTARNYNVEAVNRWRLNQVAGALKSADLLISGGGSLLQDVTGLKSIIYYGGVMWLARRLDRPVVFYAQGIGPVKSRTGRFITAREANRAKAVTVRDDESRNDLFSMGVKNGVKVVTDPVLGLDPSHIPEETGENLLREEGINSGDSPLAGVSVRPWEGQDWKEVVAAVCDQLARKGYTILFIPMQYKEDAVVSREVSSMMKNKSIILSRECTVQEMLSIVKKLRFVLGMRLHSLIFAAVSGVPPVGISYDPKVERFLTSLGQKPAGTPESLNSREVIDSIEKSLVLNAEDLQRKVAPLREKARETADFVFK